MNITELKKRLELLKHHYNKTLDKSVLGEMKRLTRLFSSLETVSSELPRR